MDFYRENLGEQLKFSLGLLPANFFVIFSLIGEKILPSPLLFCCNLIQYNLRKEGTLNDI